MDHSKNKGCRRVSRGVVEEVLRTGAGRRGYTGRREEASGRLAAGRSIQPVVTVRPSVGDPNQGASEEAVVGAPDIRRLVAIQAFHLVEGGRCRGARSSRFSLARGIP